MESSFKNTPFRKIAYSLKKSNGPLYLNNDAICFKNSKETLINIKDLILPGKHNLYNYLAAATCASVYGIRNRHIKTALKKGFMEAKNDMIISFDIDYFSEEFLIEALSLEEKYSAITASKRLKNSEDGRKPVRRIATNLFVLILKILFQTSMSDTHGMKGVRRSSCEKQIRNVVSTQDLFDTELLLRIERLGEYIHEVPAKVNEIRPSVSVIYSRIPRTIFSLIKLRIQLLKESLKTKNL